jgi:hypothetical protein
LDQLLKLGRGAISFLQMEYMEEVLSLDLEDSEHRNILRPIEPIAQGYSHDYAISQK